jgi:hypothetical protein
MNRQRLARLRRQSRRNGRVEKVVSELISEERGIPIAEVRAANKARRARTVALAVKLHLSVSDAFWLINIAKDGPYVPEEMTKEHADRTLAEMRVLAARCIAATAHKGRKE